MCSLFAVDSITLLDDVWVLSPNEASGAWEFRMSGCMCVCVGVHVMQTIHLIKYIYNWISSIIAGALVILSADMAVEVNQVDCGCDIPVTDYCDFSCCNWHPVSDIIASLSDVWYSIRVSHSIFCVSINV